MSSGRSHITIITPCYNEGETVIHFLEQLETNLNLLPFSFHVVVVNDSSTDNTTILLDNFRFHNEKIELHILNTTVNAGHQKAIYKGMCHAQSLNSDRFIIMDADGEDDPAIIPELLQYTDVAIVHVVRGERKESLFFRAGYSVYKTLFRMFTGRQMNYGNYCLISRDILRAAVSNSFIHLAAFLSRQQVEKKYITAARSKRIGGQSKMGYFKLVRHACNSFVEYTTGAQTMRVLFTKRLGKR